MTEQSKIYYTIEGNSIRMLVDTSAAGSILMNKLENMRKSGLVSFDNIDGSNQGRFKTIIIEVPDTDEIINSIDGDPRYKIEECPTAIELAARMEDFDENPMWGEAPWGKFEWSGPIEPRKR